MTKNAYLNTGFISLLSVVILVIMYYYRPLTQFSLNDVILGNVELSNIEKGNVTRAIGINYALDTVFIFTWIGSWAGLHLHFKSLNVKLIGICFGLSLLGALLDLTENAISYNLLIGNNKIVTIKSSLFIHSIIRDLSYWLPMIASFVLVLTIPKSKRISNIFLKLMGSFGVLFAILGMYIPIFSAIPYYWFVLWFLATTIFMFDNYKKGQLIE